MMRWWRGSCALACRFAVAACDGGEGEHEHGEDEAGEHEHGEHEAGEHEHGEHGEGEHEHGEHEAGESNYKEPSGMRDWAELRAPGDLSLLELPAHVQAGADSLTHVELPFDAMVETVEVAVGDAVETGDALLVLRSPGLAEAAATVASASSQIGAHKDRREHLDALRAEGIVDAGAVFE